MIEAAGRLVQQQQPGLGGQGASKFYALLGAEGQVRDRALGHGTKAEQVDHLIGARPRPGFHALSGRQPQRVAPQTRMMTAMAAHQHAFFHSLTITTLPITLRLASNAKPCKASASEKRAEMRGRILPSWYSASNSWVLRAFSCGSRSVKLP